MGSSFKSLSLQLFYNQILYRKHCHEIFYIHVILQFCDLAKRSIDDIMLIYFGTLQEAEELKSNIVQAFEKEGLKLIFCHVHAESEQKEVEFFDVNHIIDKDDPAYFITRDFVKPTAIGRVFLNGTSYHPVSTFKSILKRKCLQMHHLNCLLYTSPSPRD